MIRQALTWDLSGFSYDVDQPTQYAEKLCFVLYEILNNLKTAGVEFRQIEDTDIDDAETEITSLFDTFADQDTLTQPELTTPTNTDMLTDSGVYESLNKARASFLLEALKRYLSAQPPPEGEPPTTVEGILNEMLEIQKLELNREEIIYLSDGTPIYGRMGLIG